MRRIVALAAVAIAASSPTGLRAASSRQDAMAFAYYLQSVAHRIAARRCGPRLPGYPERFEPAYAAWHARHAVAIERGEAVFLEALDGADRQSAATRGKLETVRRAREELAAPAPAAPAAAGEAPSEGFVGWCESVMKDIEAR